MSTAIEREIRFLVEEPSVHRSVTRLASLGSFRVIRQHRERQRNTYFDTEDLRLWRERSVLKLRETKTAREVTFKRSLGYRHGIASRLEVTSRLPAPRQSSVAGQAGLGATRHLDLMQSNVRLEPMRRAQRIIGTQRLQRLFTIITDRTTLILAQDGARVELDVDRVAVRKGGGILARRMEIEVENLTSTPTVFRAAITALRQEYGRRLTLSGVSKFEFGLQAVQQVQ